MKRALVLGSLVVLLLLLPFILRDVYLMQVIITVIFYAYLTTCWNIVGGFAGSLSLGHSAYVGLGAYVSSILFLQAGITPWVGMLMAGLFAALVGIAIGYPCLRLRGPYFALTSLAFAAILQLWIQDTNEFLGLNIRGARGIMLPVLGNAPLQFQFVEKWPYYYIILFLTGLLLALTYWMHRTRFGFYLTAIRCDPSAAEAIGINVTKQKLLAFAISAFFSAIGGVFYAQWILFFNPERILGMDLSFELVFMGIIGGRATVMGPVLGAIVLVPLGELTRSYLGGGRFLGAHLIIYGIALMLAIHFLPKGLNGLGASLRNRVKAKSHES